MSDINTETIIIGSRKNAHQDRSQKAINAAQRSGADIDTSKKYAGGTNKQSQANKSTAKLDRETEELHHDHVSLDVAKLIQQARTDKKLTQKELATRINEKQQVINDYESSKAIPNQQILGKLERILGIRLRGKDKGQPLGKK